MEQWLGPALREFATTERLSDCIFTIKAADGSKHHFNCHKFIFSCASHVYERMFYGDFLESKSNEIILANVRPDTFGIFREYLYTYDTKLLESCNENTLIDLFAFAHQYLVSSVTEECISILFERIKTVDFNKLIQLYQFGHDFSLKDLITEIWNNLTSRFYRSMNDFAINYLSFDVFLNYMKLSDGILEEITRFNMIESYLKSNGFDQLALKSTDANAEGKDLEQHDQGDDNDKELENVNKRDSKNSVHNENKTDAIQNVQMKNAKNIYINSLLKLIDYMQMTPKEFNMGPGQSKFIDSQCKYDNMYKLASKYAELISELQIKRLSSCGIDWKSI